MKLGIDYFEDGAWINASSNHVKQELTKLLKSPSRLKAISFDIFLDVGDLTQNKEVEDYIESVWSGSPIVRVDPLVATHFELRG